MAKNSLPSYWLSRCDRQLQATSGDGQFQCASERSSAKRVLSVKFSVQPIVTGRRLVLFDESGSDAVSRVKGGLSTFF
jgi:hypothetical protein